ncbi:MAG: hypothetical protein Nk1A_7940 [Endomicrobiia bacterium]|nr:MAG: hypothetical protein Nk1A_7940 [Endomicrobiia bacterium]
MDGTIIVDRESSPEHIEDNEEKGYTASTGDSNSEQAKDYAAKIIKIIVDSTPEKVTLKPKEGEVEPEPGGEIDPEPNKPPNEEFRAQNAFCGTFFNHLSAYEDGKKYVTSGLSEDLGIFSIKNKKEFDSLRKGLCFLRSFVIINKIAHKDEPLIKEDTFESPKYARMYE